MQSASFDDQNDRSAAVQRGFHKQGSMFDSPALIDLVSMQSASFDDQECGSAAVGESIRKGVLEDALRSFRRSSAL